jgi:Protein of unknown function DUF262/Protein of unknown function (DUF1524)
LSCNFGVLSVTRSGQQVWHAWVVNTSRCWEELSYGLLMVDQRYEANRQTIGTLLSTTSPHIVVPNWQRSYSWASEQIETFWADLTAFDRRYPEDNINNEEYFLGSIVLVTGAGANLLLDGQQRLATATILLAALRDARRSHSRDAATRLQNKYISDFDDATATKSYVLTLNAYDRDYFRLLIQDEPGDPADNSTLKLKSHALIKKARQYFTDRIKEESDQRGGGEAAFLWNVRISRVLCNHMSVVAISSTDEDNAAEVFETLNDRGIGLSPTDLLRNLLLRRAPDEDTRARIVNAWQTVLEINEDTSVDDFLRHYWVSQYGDVKARKLYRELKTRVIDDNIDSLRLSLNLAQTAPMYRDIVQANDDDAEVRRQLEAIRALGARALYPAILAGYEVAGEDNREVLSQFLAALVTMFVRYNVVAGKETTVMEAAVYEMAVKLREERDFQATIQSLTELAPGAKEFVAGFRRISVSRVRTATYLLREIEHAMRRTQEVKVEGPDRVHLEHIYPQTPINAWSNHSAMVNRLGNLTLLGKRLNTAIKNSEFPIKKERGYENSDILMTRTLLEVDTWDASAINVRQKELSKWAFRVWNFPGEEEPADDESTSAAEVEVSLEVQLPDVP